MYSSMSNSLFYDFPSSISGKNHQRFSAPEVSLGGSKLFSEPRAIEFIKTIPEEVKSQQNTEKNQPPEESTKGTMFSRQPTKKSTNSLLLPVALQKKY